MIKENLSSITQGKTQKIIIIMITQGKKEKNRKTEKFYSCCAGDTSIKK